MSTPNDRPSLSLAEAARTLVAAHGQAMLSTLRPDDGYPYGSVVDYLPMDNGDVVMLLSRLAEHQQYLQADPRASLLIAPALGQPGMLAEGRVTLLGAVSTVSDKATARTDYLERHPQAEQYVDFGDFDFYRLAVSQVRYIAGFGRMGWLEQDRYRSAAVDVLAYVASGVIAHMNDDHSDNLRDYAHAFAQLSWAEHCRMTSIDRYGFDMLCKDNSGQHTETCRVWFTEPLKQSAQIRPVLVEMAQRARAILQGNDNRDT